MAQVPIDQATKDEYYPGQSFEWERDPVSGNMVEVPAYVDYINPDGTPHINYDYWQGFQPPPPTELQQRLGADRNVQIYAQQGMYQPNQQAVRAAQWRPSWIQF